MVCRQSHPRKMTWSGAVIRVKLEYIAWARVCSVHPSKYIPRYEPFKSVWQLGGEYVGRGRPQSASHVRPKESLIRPSRISLLRVCCTRTISIHSTDTEQRYPFHDFWASFSPPSHCPYSAFTADSHLSPYMSTMSPLTMSKEICSGRNRCGLFQRTSFLHPRSHPELLMRPIRHSNFVLFVPEGSYGSD